MAYGACGSDDWKKTRSATHMLCRQAGGKLCMHDVLFVVLVVGLWEQLSTPSSL